VIFGTVTDEGMGDDLRVTVVATGLGRAAGAARKPNLQVLRSGTDNAPAMVAASGPAGGNGNGNGNGGHDYSHLDTPAVWRSRDSSAVRAPAYDESIAERLDIPAFLRKQAD
jgi:cell division protein FtsZ